MVDSLNSWQYFSFLRAHLHILYRISMNQRNPGVELSERNQSETEFREKSVALWQAARWLSGRTSVSRLLLSVELRLCPGQNGKKGHLDPNQGSSMYIYSKRNLGFENPWVVITFEIRVAFQPQRIFQPQSEHPEGECQAVIRLLPLTRAVDPHIVWVQAWSSARPALGLQLGLAMFVPWKFKLITKGRSYRSWIF